MFVLVSMHLRNQVDTQLVKCLIRWRDCTIHTRYYIWTVASAREWEWSSPSGTAHLSSCAP